MVLFHPSAVVAFSDTSSPVVPLAASASPILRSLSSPSLVTGLLLVALHLVISNPTTICAHPSLSSFPAPSRRAFSSSSISFSLCCFSISIVLHSSFLKQVSVIACFHTGHIVEAAYCDSLQSVHLAIMWVQPLLSLLQYIMTLHLLFFVICRSEHSWHLGCSMSEHCRVILT